MEKKKEYNIKQKDIRNMIRFAKEYTKEELLKINKIDNGINK